MTRVFLSGDSMRARTRRRLPLRPSLYCETSTAPPVGKSGYSSNDLPRKASIEASSTSTKLWGMILVESPTAMPSTPCTSKSGILAGRCTGSRLRPSYEACQLVILGLNRMSSASLDRRDSM